MLYLRATIFYLLLSSIPLTNSCKSNKTKLEPKVVFFYVGTNSGDPTEGIYIFKMNPDNGKAEQVGKYPNILNPSYLNISADRKNLYAVHSVQDEKESAISSFAINPIDGKLSYQNQQSTEGRGGCHVSVTNEGNVLAANYSSGSISSLPTNQDGTLLPSTSTQTHTGSSVNKERQNSPHAHFIKQGLGGLLYAVDLGIDKIMLYQISNDGKLTPNDPAFIKMHDGAGPRHLDFHPNGKFLYVLNELEGSVSTISFNAESGAFKILQTISSLPEGFDKFNKSADIHIHPNGKYLYASNRGDHNSIAVYNIDTSTGLLSLTEIVNEAIAWPRNFTISKDGKYLICANRDSDSLTIYMIDPDSGSLKYSGQSLYAPKPICVKFL